MDKKIARKLVWAHLRCWGHCALILLLWSSVGLIGLASPLLLPNGTIFALPLNWLPVLLLLLVARKCVIDWKARVAFIGMGTEGWTRNGRAFEVDSGREDVFSSELNDLCSIMKVARPRWFVAVSEALSIKVHTPLTGQASVQITSGLLAVDFSNKERRALLAHELAHVRLRAAFFDVLTPTVNIIAWYGLAIGVIVMHALLGWHWLTLVIIVPLSLYFASACCDLVSAKISRIHESGADEMADGVVGRGSVAKVLVHLITLQHRRMPQEMLMRRARPSGFLGWCAYVYSELLESHPHELVRIERSKKR